MKLKGMKTEIITLIAGAFGFVAALVWKDAIMAWMAPVMSQGSGAVPLTLVALLVTVIALVVVYLMKKYI